MTNDNTPCDGPAEEEPNAELFEGGGIKGVLVFVLIAAVGVGLTIFTPVGDFFDKDKIGARCLQKFSRRNPIFGQFHSY